MTTEDLLKIVLALIGTGGPIGVLFAAYKSGCDKCCAERDKYREANDAALAAYRARDEELALWRLKQQAGAMRDSTAGGPA